MTSEFQACRNNCGTFHTALVSVTIITLQAEKRGIETNKVGPVLTYLITYSMEQSPS